MLRSAGKLEGWPSSAAFPLTPGVAQCPAEKSQEASGKAADNLPTVLSKTISAISHPPFPGHPWAEA